MTKDIKFHFSQKLALATFLPLLLIFVAPPTNVQGTPCSSPEVVITEDVQLVDYIEKNSACTRIIGDLRFGYQNCSIPCNVDNFSLLRNISTVNGSLSIQCCNRLTDIDTFSSLVTILGSLVVYYNRELTDINGFIELRSIQGNIVISQNNKLTSINGLSQLLTVNGYISIERNPVLNQINGLTQLTTIEGNEITSGHALSILYNGNLEALNFLSSLESINYGTVHIEGNTALCYAGYPTWQFNLYPPRPRQFDSSADKGIDWRTKLSTMEPWQYTWDVQEGGYPTLLIQNNAPNGSCSAARCHSSCPTNSGCLGPNNSSLCGSCNLIGTFDPCEEDPISEPTVTSATESNTPVILGVVLTVACIVLLVLLGLGVWACVIFTKKWKESRKGSFDISLGGIEANGSRGHSTQYLLKPKSTDLIATNEHVDTGDYEEKSRNKKHDQKRVKENVITISSYKQDLSDSVEMRGDVSTNLGIHLNGDKSESQHQFSPATENSLSSRDNHYSQSPLNGDLAKDSELVASTSSGEQNMEEILKKLREEKAEIPMDFPKEQVKLLREMGIGDFGKVLQAEARKLFPGQKKTTVVVKQLKHGASKEEREIFLKPVEAMKKLQHPNVLSLMGVVSQGPSLLVMLEYCSLGNFKTYLVTKRKEASTLKSNGQLLKMAINMASGLCYLHSMSIAHNDFAARSCLVAGEGIVKLGDYGITRQTYREDYYARDHTQKAWPIRWMAPEQVIVEGRSVLDSQPVSMPANIWSFGVALWEVCSFAQWPYDEMSNEEVIQTVITSGKCFLENPLDQKDSIVYLFDICQLCWQETSLRPTMEEVVAMLKDSSLCKNKKRTSSSLTPKNLVTAKHTRSKTLPNTSRKGNLNSDIFLSIQRTPESSGSQKHRRPAPSIPPSRPAPSMPPSRPAPPRPAPSKPTRPAPKKPPSPVKSKAFQQVSIKQPPLKPLRTEDTWKAESTEDLLNDTVVIGNPANTHSNGSLDKESLETGKNEFYINEHAKTCDNKGSKVTSTSNIKFDQDNNDNELQDADIDQSLFVGGAENDDFILEPPERFSQSSLDGLDDPLPDFARSITEKNSTSLVVEFKPPPPTDDEAITNFNEGEFEVPKESEEVPSERKDDTERERKSKKKKKRASKDYTSREGDSARNRSKKKKRRKDSVELSQEVDFPEYEFDRGMDRIPMRASQELNLSGFDPIPNTLDDSHSSVYNNPDEKQHKAKRSANQVSKQRDVDTNYGHVNASDDYNPPWLVDDNDEVGDQFYLNDDSDIPKVVYSEDVAALLW